MPELVITRLAGADVALVPIASSRARAIVDAADAPLVAGRAWRLHPDGYAVTNRRGEGVDTTVKMHALMLPVEPPLTVDHVNLNPLDNRRQNLRPATRSDQQHNRGIPRNNRSGFKGVSWHALRERWRASIRVDGRHCHLGLFDDPADAARAYDEAAKASWGEFARTNFMDAIR